MILVVGLGNPGPDYARNRHNIGFMAADEIVRRHRLGPWKRKFQAECSDGMIAGQKVMVIKPQTFMNLSGQSVGEAMRFLKVPVTDIICLHDELDLPSGKLRVKRGGGSGGHNGLKSLDAHCGQNYRRIRLGIGHPGDRALVTGYVLHDFAKAEESWLGPLIDAVAEALPLMLEEDDTGFMNRVATLTAPPKPKKAPPASSPSTPNTPASPNTPAHSNIKED